MKNLSQTTLWLGLILALTAGVIWQFYPLPDASNRINSVPLKGIGFAGENIPLSEFEQSFFKGVNVLKRGYKVGNDLFFITMLDGTHNRHIVHDPYYCLKGSGWNMVSEKDLPINKGVAKLVELERRGETREAIFWFSDGYRNYTSPMSYWWDTTVRRFTLGKSGPEPILIMVQPVSKKTVDWNAFQRTFSEIFNI